MIGTIFLKEMKEVLRDRRTLFLMIFVPLLAYPILMTIVSKVMTSQTEEVQSKTLDIAILSDGNGRELLDLFTEEGLRINQFDGFQDIQTAMWDGDTMAVDTQLYRLVADETLDGAIRIGLNFDQQIAEGSAGGVTVFFKSSKDQNMTFGRLEARMHGYVQRIRGERLDSFGIDQGFFEVLNVKQTNVSSMRENIGAFAGGILPYFFIIFCLVGCMYTAIDLAAGEKERGTIETLLTSPASRFQILMGKMAVVATSGLTSAVLSMVGIVVAVQQADVLPKPILDVVYSFIDPMFLLSMLAMLLPLAIFFASFLLTLSIYAKSFKEAQSTIQPLLIVVIVPAVIGMLPGVELNAITGLIPILNVTLATKDIIAGTLNPIYFAEVMLSLLALASISTIFSIRWYGRESVILR